MEKISKVFQFKPGVNLSSLLILVEKYNKKATSYGEFILWKYNPEDLTLSGTFNPKSGSGFLKGMKQAFQNGDLKEEFEKICRMAESL